MEVGPPKALYRQSLQTTLRCWVSNDPVLSGQGKGLQNGSGMDKGDERK